MANPSESQLIVLGLFIFAALSAFAAFGFWVGLNILDVHLNFLGLWALVASSRVAYYCITGD